MKKLTGLFIGIVAFMLNAHSQIPNNGFEDWTSAGGALKPNGWFSTNDSIKGISSYFAITKSSDHWPVNNGSWSIQLQNKTSLLPHWTAGGYAWTGNFYGNDRPAFAVTGHPTSLNGYYKFAPLGGDTLDIHFALYKDGVEVSSGKFISAATTSNWTAFHIPASNYTDADSGRIMISAFNSDNGIHPHGNSVLNMDNISFDSLIGSGISQNPDNKHFFNIFPDPTSEKLWLNLSTESSEDMTLTIYSPSGKAVFKKIKVTANHCVDISGLKNGLYFVVLFSKHWACSRELIIQR